MNRSVTRLTATALGLILGVAVSAPPALAETPPPAPQKQSLTTLSPASLKVLRSESSSVRAVQSGTSDDSFFKTKRGATVLALMAAGVAFTVWSIHHDREPVKSPVR